MSIRVEVLTKQHRGATRPTLDGVTFEVASGARAALLGPSGAGKSTLLRCLVGLEHFDGGAIVVDDVRVDPTDARSAARARMLALLRGRAGLVFQSFELFPHLTVLDNCTLAPQLVRKETRDAARDRARALLEELGLGDKAAAFPDHLSGGQRQRVAIARALAMQPRVLLYDEPTSALDPSLRGEVKGTLERVAATGITQLVVTHDVAFAREACDQVFVLDAGRIVESGPARAVLGAPQHEVTRRLVG